ncbi:MAG: hypothetical protein ABWZ76_13570 [Acidimicrobiales bacterium]
MTTDPFAPAQRVADAVLWEGYVLYPYRASAAKNQVRWQYGVLAPRPYSEADSSERWSMQTECVVDLSPSAAVQVRLRYLQVQTRTVEEAVDEAFKPVAELEVDGALWASWDEAVEHVLDLPPVDLARPGSQEVTLTLPAGLDVEPLGTAGRVVRERWEIEGVVRVETDVSPGPYPLAKLRVTVENVTDWCDTDVPRDEVMRRSLIGVHTLLHADDARFISLLEPPEFAQGLVAECANEGTFPVLVGEGDDRTMLSSPIILYDHPTVAPTSPGDMCDLTEIDEILALRILTLTDDEKRQARSTDARAAAIVDRIEDFSPDVFSRLHGEMVPVGSLPTGDEAVPWWEPAVDASVNPWEDSILIAGVEITKGSRVRLRPGRAAGRRTDAQDLFLAGMTATVEGVFLDVDGDQHVAVVLDDDPGAELQRAQGRFMYFHPDEVEPQP